MRIHKAGGRPTCVILMGAMAWSLGAGPGMAETLPGGDGTDLTLPPEMRAGTAAPPTRHPVNSRQAQRNVGLRTDRDVPAPHHAAATPSHPVELGMTVRGGSGTPRVYGSTGTSEGIQESGSAFGAGMRFGF